MHPFHLMIPPHAWALMQGPLCMKFRVWAHMQGPLCMNSRVWACAWGLIHGLSCIGLLCMGFCVWAFVYGFSCMGFRVWAFVYGQMPGNETSFKLSSLWAVYSYDNRMKHFLSSAKFSTHENSSYTEFQLATRLKLLIYTWFILTTQYLSFIEQSNRTTRCS